MRSLEEQLSKYAAYHRDRRNIATHYLGIPMIVLSIDAFLSRPVVEIAGISLAPVFLVTLVVLGFYFLLDLRFGLAMTGVLALTLWGGLAIGKLATSAWLVTSAGLFIGGWAIQFIGHFFEGKKPAFVDDLVGLLVGPLFLVAESAFAVGLRPELHEAIERRVGPTRPNKRGTLPA